MLSTYERKPRYQVIKEKKAKTNRVLITPKRAKTLEDESKFEMSKADAGAVKPRGWNKEKVKKYNIDPQIATLVNRLKSKELIDDRTPKESYRERYAKIV